MKSLRVLIVSPAEPSSSTLAQLEDAGHTMVPVQDLTEALEALEIQRFDVVLLDQNLDSVALAGFARKFKGLAAGNTGLFWLPRSEAPCEPGTLFGTLEGAISDLPDAGALTQAIARLAEAVGTSTVMNQSFGQPALDVEELRSQVAYDDELLAELIDLFICEREKQVEELRQAMQIQDFALLSRVAHTIKGSLASLHADPARLHAQALESAAKEGDGSRCRDLLPQFEERLDEVQEQLLALRSSLGSC